MRALILLPVILALAACGGGPAPQASPTTSPTAEAPTSPDATATTDDSPDATDASPDATATTDASPDATDASPDATDASPTASPAGPEARLLFDYEFGLDADADVRRDWAAATFNDRGHLSACASCHSTLDLPASIPSSQGFELDFVMSIEATSAYTAPIAHLIYLHDKNAFQHTDPDGWPIGLGTYDDRFVAVVPGPDTGNVFTGGRQTVSLSGEVRSGVEYHFEMRATPIGDGLYRIVYRIAEPRGSGEVIQAEGELTTEHPLADMPAGVNELITKVSSPFSTASISRLRLELISDE